MTRYSGNSPYCYSNTLAMTLGHPVEAATIEALTGSAFGYQRVGPLPLFDPPGWNPDRGLDQALEIMGVAHERRTFLDPTSALDALRSLVASGPVFVGPLEMGLLRHQPGSDRPTGADHFVAVLHLDDERVIMHDPQGHPYAALPVSTFMAAWGAETIGYAEGRYPLRTGFTTPVGTPEQWATASLQYALAWATGEHAIPVFPPGNVAGLSQLCTELTSGSLEEPTPSVLADFALRLGSRRRDDTAEALHAYPDLARPLRHQASVIGGAQLDVILADWPSLVTRIRQISTLHEEITTAIRAAL